jgi:hypothetical protein
MKFQKFSEFLSESLAFLSFKKTMKNEFMNRIDLKQDFEDSKRIFYNNASCILTHIEEDRFELRTPKLLTTEELSKFIDEQINAETKSMKFKVFGKPKNDILKEKIWTIKAKID